MLPRRGFLSLLAAGAASSWVEAAFAAGPSTRETELVAAWHAARRAGLPLLVIVVPPQDDGIDRGWIVGATLNNASDDLKRRLAGYAPACATLADLRLLGAQAPDDAWFVVVGTGVPADVTAIAGPEKPRSYDEGMFDVVQRILLDHVPDRGAGGADPAATWIGARIPGSYWEDAGGCGTTIEEYEGDDNWAIACGMGSVSPRSARFLNFYLSVLDEAP